MAPKRIEVSLLKVPLNSIK